VRDLTHATHISSDSSLDGPSRPRPLVTVVVPVYNGGEDVVANVTTIQRAVSDGVGPDRAEVIVVSDGSIDETAERLLAARTETQIRVIHYDRNLGKGYAVKAGALASHGEWVALVDADLDLDPASIPRYLEIARSEQLDFAIGSKRHPESVVQYPLSRRVASWCYQQLNRILFRLDVRDTQVGLKVFSRRVVEDVMPLLLVKRFAFDLELLAVANALGYGRVRELPIRLDYRFTGSGVRSRAVVFALWDTAAIFYRLRILRTYQRKLGLVGRTPSPPDELPRVSVAGDESVLATLDYPRLEMGDRGQLVALLSAGARPAGNWISACVVFFGDLRVAAVVVPTIAPLPAPLRVRLAAAVLESRLGGGSRRSAHFPGNVRVVGDDPAHSIVMRGADYHDVIEAQAPRHEWVRWLAARGRRTVYTPDTSTALPPPPLLRPHLAATYRYARARGGVARRTHGRSLSRPTALSLAPAAAGAVGLGLVFASGALHTAGLALLLTCGGALVVSGVHAALRFRSFAVGALEPPVVVLSQLVYLAGFIRGIFR
jgi:glycosyltransferase involved in cell wall biosynthesis